MRVGIIHQIIVLVPQMLMYFYQVYYVLIGTFCGYKKGNLVELTRLTAANNATNFLLNLV